MQLDETNIEPGSITSSCEMFIAFFWTRSNGDLITVEERVQSRKAAEILAQHRGWRLVGVEKDTPEFRERLAADKQKASLQILHFEAVKAGRKHWWEDIPTSH